MSDNVYDTSPHMDDQPGNPAPPPVTIDPQLQQAMSALIQAMTAQFQTGMANARAHPPLLRCCSPLESTLAIQILTMDQIQPSSERFSRSANSCVEAAPMTSTTTQSRSPIPSHGSRARPNVGMDITSHWTITTFQTSLRIGRLPRKPQRPPSESRIRSPPPLTS